MWTNFLDSEVFWLQLPKPVYASSRAGIASSHPAIWFCSQEIAWNPLNYLNLVIITLKHQNCTWLNWSLTEELLLFVFDLSLLYLHFKTYQYIIRNNSPKVEQHWKDLCLSNYSKTRKISYCLHKNNWIKRFDMVHFV